VYNILDQLKKLSLFSVAAYFLMFALCAKGVYYYASDHPAKEELLSIDGRVKDINLGGQGNATRLEIKSHYGTHLYSSYYGIVWPGMELIRTGDEVDVLAERNKLNRNEFIDGKRYYIWQLIHKGHIIIEYYDILELVRDKDAAVNRYINYWLVISFVIFVIAHLRKILQS
jgi:hypothetical protein